MSQRDRLRPHLVQPVAQHRVLLRLLRRRGLAPGLKLRQALAIDTLLHVLVIGRADIQAVTHQRYRISEVDTLEPLQQREPVRERTAGVADAAAGLVKVLAEEAEAISLAAGLAVHRTGDMAPHLAECARIDLRAQILQDGIPAPHLCRVTHHTRFQISHHGPPGKAQHRGFPKPPRRELGEAPALGSGPERLRPQRGISPPGVGWIRLPAAGAVGTAS